MPPVPSWQMRGIVGEDTMISRQATLLTATALAAVLGLPGLAAAQQVPTTTPTQAVELVPQEDDATTVDEVVVTGVRAAVASALQVKRNNDQISDSIVAEDIGKLPDNNVSEALSRVTGVQVQRTQGEGIRTLVRGLPNVVTTLNGRNIFTTAGRGISLADVPADLLQRVDVYKTAIPENISGGIAGGINVQLRRPFDLPGFTAAASVRGIYSDQSEAYDPNGSILLSNRWTNGAGEFGALVSVSHQEREFQENNTFNGTYFSRERPGGTGPTDLLQRPDVVGYIYTLGERTRDSAEIALQWRPNDDLEFYLDGFGVDFQNDSELNFFVGLPVFIGLTPDNYTLKPGTNVLQTLTGTNAFTKTSNQAYEDESQTYQIAFGGAWDATDRLKITGDIAYTKSTFENRNVILDTAFIAPSITYNFDNDGAVDIRVSNADGTPFDLTSPGEPFFLDQYFENRSEQEGDEFAAMGAAEYTFAEDGFFTSIKGGLRFASRTGASNSSNPSGSFAPFDGFRVRNIATLTGRSGIEGVTPDNLLEGSRDVGNRQFFVADREFLLDNADVLRPLFGRSAAIPAYDPARFFDDKEDSVSGYVQARFASEMGDIPFDGLIGVRVERTESELSGFITDNTGPTPVVTALTVAKTDTEYLPSLNVRFELTDDLDLRFGAARTVTRPFFGDLNPAVSLTTPAVGVPGTGSGGNPLLDNVLADSYDLSLEWYFDEGSLFSVTGFYRDITGFVVRTAANETINGQVFAVNRPQSAGSGSLQGLEAGVTHFFDDLPGLFSGFGVQLNATYIDGETELPGDVIQPFQDVSELSYNAVLIYERGPFSSRLAYNWRDEYITAFNQVGDQPTTVYSSPQGFLDFSANYRLNEKLTVSVDAVNILDEEIVNYFGGRGDNDQDIYPRDVATWERTFSVGLRARF